MRKIGIALLALVGSTVLARSAEAAVVTCTVNNVSYPTLSSVPGGWSLSYRYLAISCDSTYYYLNISGGSSISGCNQADADTVKLVASTAQAAKLSGKPLTIYYTPGQSCPAPVGTMSVNYTTTIVF